MLINCQDTVGASGGDPTLADRLGQLHEASFGQAGPAMRKAYPPTRRMTGSQLARYLGRRTFALASTTRPDGRAHAAPTRLGNVRAHPWLALSIIEGEHDTHAAVLTEGPAEVLPTAPQRVQSATKSRNRA